MLIIGFLEILSISRISRIRRILKFLWKFSRNVQKRGIEFSKFSCHDIRGDTKSAEKWLRIHCPRARASVCLFVYVCVNLKKFKHFYLENDSINRVQISYVMKTLVKKNIGKCIRSNTYQYFFFCIDFVYICIHFGQNVCSSSNFKAFSNYW